MSASDAAYDADYEAYDDENEPLPGLFILLTGLLIVAAFGAVVWMAYQQGVRNGRGDVAVPYVQADPEDVKYEHPVEEPGEQLAAYDALEDGADAERPEFLMQSAEEPILPDPADDGRSEIDEALASAVERSGAETAADEAEADPLAAEAERLLAEAGRTVSSEPASPSVAPARSEPAPRPARKPTPAAASKPAASEPMAAALDPAGGSHVVQVASLRDAAEAERQWARLQGQFPALTDGLGPDIEEAAIPDRGTYYRLRVGPFTSKSDASEFCAKLKAGGRDCLVKPA